MLGQYLFSDVELTAAPAEVEEPTVEVPTVDVTNPSTRRDCLSIFPLQHPKRAAHSPGRPFSAFRRISKPPRNFRQHSGGGQKGVPAVVIFA